METTKTTHSKLASNAAAGLVATAVHLISRLLLTPFVLSYLTLSEFGLWSMCFVILSYAAMGAFGVNNTYVRYTARFQAAGQWSKISELLSTGVFGMLLFCSLFWAILFFTTPWIVQSFHVDRAMTATATLMILGTAAVFCLELILGAFRSVVEGLQEIALVKKISTAAALFEVVAIMLFLSQGSGLQGMLYAYSVRVLLEAAGCILAARRLLPALRLSPAMMSREQLRHLFVFGGKVQLLGIMAIFFSAFDRMVITALSGLTATGLFEVGRKLPFTAKSVAAATFGPFLPAAAGLSAQSLNESPRSRSERVIAYLRIVMLALCLALSVLPWLPEALRPTAWFPWSVSLFAGGAAFFWLRLLGRNFAGNAAQPEDSLRTLYLSGLRYINLINVTLFAFLAAVANPLITAWVGSGYEQTHTVLLLLTAGYLMQQCTGPVTMIFRGIDRCGRELEYLLLQIVLALVLLPAGTLAYGLTGAAAAIAASTTIASIYLFWRSNHAFQVSLSQFSRHTLAPTLFPLVAAGGIYGLSSFFAVTTRFSAAVQVLFYGLLYLALVLPPVWSLILTSADRKRLVAMVDLRKKETLPC